MYSQKLSWKKDLRKLEYFLIIILSHVEISFIMLDFYTHNFFIVDYFYLQFNIL